MGNIVNISRTKWIPAAGYDSGRRQIRKHVTYDVTSYRQVRVLDSAGRESWAPELSFRSMLTSIIANDDADDEPELIFENGVIINRAKSFYMHEVL